MISNTEVEVEATVRCSIILTGGNDPSRLSAYLRTLAAMKLSESYEPIIINDQRLQVDQRQLRALLPAAKVLNPDRPLTQEQSFDTGAMAARGKYLLLVKSLVSFDELVLEESIKDLETSGEKVSISANGNFVLVERLDYSELGGFARLLETLRSRVRPDGTTSSDRRGVSKALPRNVISRQTNQRSAQVIYGTLAIKKLLSDYSFNTVLDIGCGDGTHTEIFREHNKTVTSIDLEPKMLGAIHGNYMRHDFAEQDCIWCCHVLEHQLNANAFLKKVHKELKDNGILAITVPPLKHEIVGGHVTLWNAGLLMYNLVLAGFDCSNIAIKTYGYNISVILKKKKISLPDNLHYDKADLEKLSHFFPDFVHQGFNGDIREYNWD